MGQPHEVLHSKAKNIWLVFVPPATQHAFRRSRRWIGFDLDQSALNHYGLVIMRERATAVDATLTIETEPGMGSCVVVSLKCDED